jgi:hypothetical protein
LSFCGSTGGERYELAIFLVATHSPDSLLNFINGIDHRFSIEESHKRFNARGLSKLGN